ncbi:hypothetical protein LINPERHAP1_LOCUS21138 [Linum perenne]
MAPSSFFIQGSRNVNNQQRSISKLSSSRHPLLLIFNLFTYRILEERGEFKTRFFQ